MLDIRDMLDKDKLFTFMDGLKLWARLELQRQWMTDLGSAMTAAEHLIDFASETRRDRQTTPSPAQNKAGGAKSFRSNYNRGGGDRKPHAQTGSQGSSNRNKPQENRQGRHRGAPVEPQAPASGKNDPEEDEDNLGAISQWCNTLSHQVAAKKILPPRAGNTAPALTASHPEEETQPRNPQKNGLMFLDVKIHGKPIRAMVDTGATHNYLASTEVERLRLVLEKGVGRVKAINSFAQPIAGVAKAVLIKVGPFEGKTNLSVVVMDDFKLIIGLDFLRDTSTAVFPHVDSLMMMGAKPCVIPTLAGRTGERNLSAMQFEKGCKRSEPSYMCTLRFNEIEEASRPIPGMIKKLLKEFEDVMPDKLPRKLSPKRAVDHEIELVPGTKPPARAPYRMTQPELVELRKQLKDILESGIIKPAKSSYGAPVLFQKKADGSLRMCCDYRALNKITVKNKYPIPLVADYFDCLSQAKYFTKIDLRSGYWQVRIKEDDEAKTTVVISLWWCTWTTLLSTAEHVEHLRQVLARLREYELYAKVSKCSFAQETISFLRHIVERGRIRMDPKKVHIIKEWQPPSDGHDLRSFLGLANYYRHFVKGYSEIARPMTSCVVETDASDFALGGVLMQDGHPVAFESRKLKDVERRYSVHEKELLAVVHCLKL
ncbi:UNVERIFIED_CONTAM: Retrovirus-related Pol polyprotein from transposon gypsy [Sesamum radiatum]|uniref:Retrovirus-related Pol polyprotein from transposon gypsy n=1 Tax=Sesamum radiatum TaxID=300843 RepID=A0AAW2W3J3_SESRA